ncbi:MAG: hypothetical protein WC635_05475 [Bacteriovorax sp.]|jgi:hypothetical protein
MFDKLEMRSEEILNLKELEKVLPHKTAMMGSSSYKRALYVLNSSNEVLFIIHSDPIWSNMAPTKISTNPKRWSSFNDFRAALAKFCNPDLLEITRIDHAVDIEISIEKLYQCTRIKNKTQYSYYKEHCSVRGTYLTGFYLGVEPEIYCIYDKGYQKSLRNKKLVRNKDCEIGLLSRIELRQRKHKVKYKHLNELINYLTDTPFTNIEFYEAKDNSKKAEALQLLMNEDGLQRAVAQLSRHNNFSRNNKKNLTPTNLESTVRDAYEENLRRFFEVSQ